MIPVIALPLAALCAAMMFTDLRHLRIPDAIPLALLALFGLWLAVDGAAFMLTTRLVIAGLTFCVCFALFAARLMGGGDAKVLPALALFVPPARLPDVMLLFAVCLIGSIILILSARRLFPSVAEGWAVLHSRKLPMGAAIGATGLAVLTYAAAVN